MRFQRIFGLFLLIIGVLNDSKRKEIKKTTIGTLVLKNRKYAKCILFLCCKLNFDSP